MTALNTLAMIGWLLGLVPVTLTPTMTPNSMLGAPPTPPPDAGEVDVQNPTALALKVLGESSIVNLIKASSVEAKAGEITAPADHVWSAPPFLVAFPGELKE